VWPELIFPEKQEWSRGLFLNFFWIAYGIEFGVQAGVGAQSLKMFWSRSRVTVHSAKAGVESESKILD